MCPTCQKLKNIYIFLEKKYGNHFFAVTMSATWRQVTSRATDPSSHSKMLTSAQRFCWHTKNHEQHQQKQQLGHETESTYLTSEFDLYSAAMEHWTGEVSVDKWVPIFPVFNWLLELWIKIFFSNKSKVIC